VVAVTARVAEDRARSIQAALAQAGWARAGHTAHKKHAKVSQSISMDRMPCLRGGEGGGGGNDDDDDDNARAASDAPHSNQSSRFHVTKVFNRAGLRVGELRQLEKPNSNDDAKRIKAIIHCLQLKRRRTSSARRP